MTRSHLPFIAHIILALGVWSVGLILGLLIGMGLRPERYAAELHADGHAYVIDYNLSSEDCEWLRSRRPSDDIRCIREEASGHGL